MHVTHPQPLADVRCRRLVGDCREQAVEVQRRRPAVVSQAFGPLIAWPVGRQLDSVVVDVGQVYRLVRSMIRGALDRRLRHRQAHRSTGELFAARIQKRIVVQAGMAARRARLRVLVQEDHRLAAVTELGFDGVVPVNAQAE